ncbi:MAG: fasciclin domain-containing protein [Chloroflexota bacterium]
MTRTVSGLALAGMIFAACSTGGGASTAAATAVAPSMAPSMEASMEPSMEPSMEASPMTGEAFGAACSAVPASGAGSFEGMATDPVATAASNNPVLSTLVTAVTAAGLGDTLNTAEDITVFAPSNDAFAAMDKATMDSAMADPKGLLTTVLTYHVVPGRLTPDQLAGTHKTLQGGTLEVTGSGESFTVNGSAMVICGNVQTANATVYIIDGVLLPPAS